MNIAQLAHPDSEKPKRYEFSFLTDQWAWEVQPHASTVEEAKAAARTALVGLVQAEKPELACVTLLEDGFKIGVWDWVEGQPWWTDF